MWWTAIVVHWTEITPINDSNDIISRDRNWWHQKWQLICKFIKKGNLNDSHFEKSRALDDILTCTSLSLPTECSFPFRGERKIPSFTNKFTGWNWKHLRFQIKIQRSLRPIVIWLISHLLYEYSYRISKISPQNGAYLSYRPKIGKMCAPIAKRTMNSESSEQLNKQNSLLIFATIE